MTSKTGQRSVACFGEIIWDLFPDGRRNLGGAPANVAYHLRRLGIDATLISRVGSDALGRRALERLEQAGLSTLHVQVDETLPTGVATISSDPAGEVRYEIATPAAWDAIEPACCGTPYAVVFGTLSQRDPRCRAALRTLIGGATERVYDVNFRPPHTPVATVAELLSMATIVKMNESEAEELGRKLGLAAQPERFVREIVDLYGPRAVCVTCGRRGAWVFSADGLVSSRGVETEVCDSVGAGDAFLAALVAGLLAGAEWPQTLAKANELGAWVASKRGAMPE